MNYDKDVQFVIRGNLTRMWVHLCGEYDKEIDHCLLFPFTVYHFPLLYKLEKIQIHNSWSYRIRWCVNACNKTGNSVMYMCAYLCGLSIGVWGCHIVIFFDGFLSIFYSIEWWRTWPRNKCSNMQMACDMYSTKS